MCGCLQILSVAISATFTALQGQVTDLFWEFREDLYTSVRGNHAFSVRLRTIVTISFTQDVPLQ